MDHYFLTLINGGGPLCNIQRLKAECDEALSSFAFKFNLRRYDLAMVPDEHPAWDAAVRPSGICRHYFWHNRQIGNPRHIDS